MSYNGNRPMPARRASHRSDLYGIMASLTIHALLLVLLMYIKADPEPPAQLGFIQVEFGAFSEGRPVRRAVEDLPKQPEPEPEPEPEVETPPAPADPEESKPVDLPDAPEITPEEPPIPEQEADVEAIQPEEPEDEEEIEEEEEAEPEPIRPLGSGSTEGRSGAEQGDQGTGKQEEKAAPFQIEGLNREPVMTPLPDYREKVNVTIRMRITVNPRGEIVQSIPLMKGNPTLEASVMEALRSWRFNPLPHNVPQENQTGVITFRFRLE